MQKSTSMKIYVIEYLSKGGKMTVSEFDETGEYLGTSYPEFTFSLDEDGNKREDDLSLRDENCFMISEFVELKEYDDDRSQAMMETICSGRFNNSAEEVMEYIIDNAKFLDILAMAQGDAEVGPI